MTRYHIYINGVYKATASNKAKSRKDALNEYIDLGFRLLLSDKVEILEDNTPYQVISCWCQGECEGH